MEHTGKLTLTPTACGPADVETLRAVGLTDAAISEATQVIAYFNYINRIAEGLGIEMEDWLDALGREL